MRQQHPYRPGVEAEGSALGKVERRRCPSSLGGGEQVRLMFPKEGADDLVEVPPQEWPRGRQSERSMR